VCVCVCVCTHTYALRILGLQIGIRRPPPKKKRKSWLGHTPLLPCITILSLQKDSQIYSLTLTQIFIGFSGNRVRPSHLLYPTPNRPDPEMKGTYYTVATSYDRQAVYVTIGPAE